MTIELHDLGKRFNRHWIFRKVSYQFESGNAYAIVGPNGSGKSTLLQVMAGAVEKSEGEIQFWDGGQKTAGNLEKNILPPENHFKQLSIAAPYLELIEELTLTEFLSFHHFFKPLLPGHSIRSMIDYIGLGASAHKQVRYFSSGMRQRVKLAQAVFSHTPVVMLDEPTSNLDTNGIALYHKLVQDFCQNRLLIVCSNDEQEISFCSQRLNISDYTPKP